MQTKTNTTDAKQATQASTLFPLGQIMLTPGAIDALNEAGQMPHEFIERHAKLEQGELSEDDYKENLFSADKHLRIFSAYQTARNAKLWIITEADRSATTILLPSEY